MTTGQVLLILTLAVPAAGALIAAGLPARADLAGRLVATVAAAVALVASVGLYWGRGSAGWSLPSPAHPIQPWHQINASWAPAIDLRFHIGVDGISYPLVVLTTLLTLLCAVYTLWNVPSTVPAAPAAGHDTATLSGVPATGPAEQAPPARRGRLLMALMLVIEVGVSGVFMAFNLVLFFVSFEIVLLPMYAVIAGWGGPAKRAAARKFVLYTLLGSVLLLVGVFTVVAAGHTADLIALTARGGAGIARTTQMFAFVLLAVAFAVKSPLWPLHTWLPDAHTEAPTIGSVILAGVLLKMGTYGLLRVGVGVVPAGARWAAPVLGVLAVAAILVGALVSLAQTELKRLIAYSSVGHMGFVVLGIATLNATGLLASLIGNIAHGLITGLLFFLAGSIKDRTHTGDLAQLGGLRETAPRLAGLLGFGAIASLGLPGLAGFWGEAFAVVAALRHGGVYWTVLAVFIPIGGALGAAYFLRLLRRVTHGPATPATTFATGGPGGGLAIAEVISWAPLVLLTLAVGLLPALVLGPAQHSVQALIEVIR